jgi:hypothetical protein
LPPSKKKLTLLAPVPIPSTLKTPNPSNRKVAILGAHPSWRQAPFNDPDWEIWGMSAGMWHLFPRWDLWFEIHPNLAKYDHIAARNGKKGYADFVAREAVKYDTFPFQKMLDRFGPYFFTTGQITWMLAYAISLKFDVIGIWGVEASGEYSPQRKDIHHFVQCAHDNGIRVEIPDGCPLLDKPKLYAFTPR